jgi:hypothetical protein
MRLKFAALATPAPKDAPMNVQPPLGHPPLGQSPLSMFRPVLWLAAAAFAAGFGGYMILGLRAING